MNKIYEQLLRRLKKEYVPGTRVELVLLKDRFLKINPQERGTVLFVDDFGTIHVRWDCGIACGIVYGEDRCRKVEEKINDEILQSVCFDYYCKYISMMMEVIKVDCICRMKKYEELMNSGNQYKAYKH